MDFSVPYDGSSHSLYSEMKNDPAYYRVIITLESDPIFSYSPAFHGKELFDGYYIEGTPLRDVVYALRWMSVHPERGGLLAPYFEMLSIRRFITSPNDGNLPNYLATYPEEDFTFHSGADYAYFELNSSIQPVRACSSALYVGSSSDVYSVFESLLFSHAPLVLIKGQSPYIDDYSLGELSQYDSLLLFRWASHDRSRGEDLLRSYVEQGGTIFAVGYYQEEMLGRRFYAASSFGNCSQGYSVEANSSYADTIFHNVNTTDFAPAIYSEGPWQYCAIENSSNVVMRIDGKPVLAVDQVGKGKVIWLGFNILTHIWFYLNQQEAQLIRNTVEYALASYHEGWINNLIMDKRPYGYIDMSFSMHACMHYPVNPNGAEVLGDKCYSDLRSLPEKPDVVDFVVPPKVTEEIVKTCKDLDISKVWMQPGSESKETIRFCKASGIDAIYGACIMIECRKRRDL
jgi:hypothetical protein